MTLKKYRSLIFLDFLDLVIIRIKLTTYCFYDYRKLKAFKLVIRT